MELEPLKVLDILLEHYSVSEPLKIGEEKINSAIDLSNRQTTQLNKHTEWLQFIGDEVIRKMELRPYFFNQLSEMLSASYLHTGNCCFVLGNESPIDGKMRLFYLLNDNTIVPDNINIFETNNHLKAIYIPDKTIANVEESIRETIKEIEKEIQKVPIDGGNLDDNPDGSAQDNRNIIQFKRGKESSLTNLSDGEPFLATDTKKVFLGNTPKRIELVTKEQLEEEKKNLLFQMTLPVNGWTQNGEMYSLAFTNSTIKPGMKLNISPANDNYFSQLSANGVTSLCIKNNNGAATILLFGNKPTTAGTIQIEAIPIKTSTSLIYGEMVSLGGGGFVVADAAPVNKKQLWIQRSTGILKYYNGSSWVNIVGVYA